MSFSDMEYGIVKNKTWMNGIGLNRDQNNYRQKYRFRIRVSACDIQMLTVK